MIDKPLSGFQLGSAVDRSFVLDDIDVKLLTLLTKDARMSRRQLAKAVEMSAPGVGARLARLEAAGVIRGYSVVLGWAALGFVTCYLSVTATSDADQASLMRAIGEVPEVVKVDVVTGSIDMIAQIRVRDYAHLRRLLVERLWQIEGLRRTETLLSLVDYEVQTDVGGILDGF